MDIADLVKSEMLLREIPDLSDISFIILPGVDRGFTDEGKVPEYRIVQETAEPAFTDGSHTNVLMPIQSAPKCTF